MKRRLTALLLTAVMGLTLAACGGKAEDNMSAISRELGSGDGQVHIADVELPLAGSLKTEGMTPEEEARADELRAMAVEAMGIVNTRRAERGLPALAWSEDLERCALIRASEIVSTWSHTRPDGSDWWTVNSELMYGENIAKNFKDASGVVEGWLNSPGHAANIFDENFVTCSIAIYEAGGSLYFAQEFGY